MFMEKHRAKMAESTTASQTTQDNKKHNSMFSFLNIKEI